MIFERKRKKYKVRIQTELLQSCIYEVEAESVEHATTEWTDPKYSKLLKRKPVEHGATQLMFVIEEGSEDD